MRALYDFIVEVEDRYNNKVDVDGKELIVNTEISENDHIFVNRRGTVTGIPSEIETDIQVGDEVLVHHNVFRRWYDMRGKEKNGRAFLFGNAYTVQPEQIFGYWRGNVFRPVRGYTFVQPIYSQNQWSGGELEGRGIVAFSEVHDEGRQIAYKPGMNVEFNIDGIKYYRILNKFIHVEFEETNTEINQELGESA